MQRLRYFFSPDSLKESLLLAFCFSAFIYLFHFNLNYYLLNSLLGLYAFYLLLGGSRKVLLFAGFFIGLLWFYWIGFSFRYYGMSWALPFVSLGFALIYAFVFWLISWPSHPLLRALMLFGLSFFEPFDFNWLQPELLFVQSYFGIEKWQYALILLSLALMHFFKEKRPYLFLPLLLPALSFSSPQAHDLPLDISMVQTKLSQEEKWNPHFLPEIIKANLQEIEQAIEAKKEVVVLPESAFPLFLNRDIELMEELKLKSYDITIITGSLLYEDHHNYNATYLFQNGQMQIAKKMVLVPFGEYIPLPSFLARPINRIIFDGASDYLNATEPTDFIIHSIPFRNAICYEATCHELFTSKPKYMIAISNNAWFTPSIEPSLQRLLMQFYATKSGTTILHAANGSGGGIIYP